MVQEEDTINELPIEFYSFFLIVEIYWEYSREWNIQFVMLLLVQNLIKFL